MLLEALFSLLILKTLASEDGRSIDLLISAKQEGLDIFQRNNDPLPSNCYEALRGTQNSRINTILVPKFSENPFKVACDLTSMGGGWTIILQRTDGSENFYREWRDYRDGFGNLSNEFFLGLDKLQAMTSSDQQELLVLMQTQQGKRAYALYDNFRVGPETNDYKLESLGNYSGDAGDSLTYHLGMKFSTKDRKNDISQVRTCAQYYSGAWWYRNCMSSNLAGQFGDNTFGRGLVWETFSGFTNSLKNATMMIRPKAFCYKCF